MIHEMILNLVVPRPQHEGFFMRAISRPTQSIGLRPSAYQKHQSTNAP